MKLLCDKNELTKTLFVVNKAVSARPSHAVLANVLINVDAETNEIKLTAFDFSMGIKATVLGTAKESGEVTLPARLLNEIISKLPDGEIALSCDEQEDLENPIVLITAKSSKFQLHGMKSDEFPELPIVKDDTVLTLSKEALVQGIACTAFSASKDETKQCLTGIHLTLSKSGTLEFAATDGHRLSVMQTYLPTDMLANFTKEDEPDLISLDDLDNDVDPEDELEDEDESQEQKIEVTIPARFLSEFEKILASKENDSIRVLIDEEQIAFFVDNYHFTSRTLSGTYPDYNRLLPKDFAHEVVLERKQLITILERVAVLSDAKNNLVKFGLNPDEEVVIVSVDAKELGSAKETIKTSSIIGDPLEIGFNLKYLLESLKAIPSVDVQILLNEPTHPVIIAPLNGLNLKCLIMPVQIRE